jgi:hypothetical protein
MLSTDLVIIRESALHKPPFRRAYEQLWPPLQQFLASKDIGWTQLDGELFYDLCKHGTTTFFSNLVQECLSVIPQPVDTHIEKLITEQLTRLLISVKEGKQSDDYTPLEQQWALQARKHFLTKNPSEVAIEAILKKWRHWNPKSVTIKTPTTQRALEINLRMKWLERIISHFLPYVTKIHNMETVSQAKDPLREYFHLFGDARWRTIRIHCLALEWLIKQHGLQLPWTEDTLRNLLNTFVDQESTPTKVQRAWLTLKWLSKKLALLDPESCTRLQIKRDAVKDALITTTAKPQRRATLPSMHIILMLEEGCQLRAQTGDRVPATGARLRPTDPFILAIARFLLGSSGRFSDIQHCAPSSWIHTSSTTELTAWQTKTTNILQAQRKALPLIAPLHTFSGVQWWNTFHFFMRSLQSHKIFQTMDYIIPTVNRDGTGFIPRPCTYERSLLWLRDTLIRLGAPTKEVQSLTWHSFRLFIPDCAFQAMIPKEQRQYLGNWSSANLPDVYTREKRHVVCAIWSKVVGNIPSTASSSHRQVREDLNHPDWQDPQPQLNKKRRSKESQDSPGTSVGDSVPNSPEQASVTVSRLDSDDDDRWSLAKSTTTVIQTPSDQVPPPIGPLVLGSRIKTNRGQRILHLFSQQGKGIGCGWSGLSKCQNVSYEDYDRERELHRTCALCFRLYTFPTNFQIQKLTNDEEAQDPSDPSSPSESDHSVDTDSDEEAVLVQSLSEPQGDRVP